jgi:hypothetical protein
MALRGLKSLFTLEMIPKLVPSGKQLKFPTKLSIIFKLGIESILAKQMAPHSREIRYFQ